MIYPDFDAARSFLFEHLAASPASAGSRRYRFEHCLRVARIGRSVAEAEGLDAAGLELGCLLHDIGKYDAAVPVDHGRAGARVIREYFDSLGFRAAVADEIVQGIAMHVDGLSNPRGDDQGTGHDAAGCAYLSFSGEPSILARSIGDCDNVDRFSTYRVADTLKYVRFMDKTAQEQRDFIAAYVEGLEGQYAYTCATATAQALWLASLDYQRDFFMRLGAEIG